MQGCIRSQPSSYLTQSKSYASRKGEQCAQGLTDGTPLVTSCPVGMPLCVAVGAEERAKRSSAEIET